MTDLEALKARISDEADLCRNEGATDIAALLDDTRYTIETQAREIEWMREALTMIAHHIRDESDPYEEDYWGCRSIARAALAGDSNDQ